MDPKDIIAQYNRLKQEAVSKISDKIEEAGKAIADAKAIAAEFGLRYEFPEIESVDYYERQGWNSSNC